MKPFFGARIINRHTRETARILHGLSPKGNWRVKLAGEKGWRGEPTSILNEHWKLLKK